MSDASRDHQQRLDDLHEKFAALGLRGYWQNQREQQRTGPRLGFAPL